jgi:hypothetical protein
MHSDEEQHDEVFSNVGVLVVGTKENTIFERGVELSVHME